MGVREMVIRLSSSRFESIICCRLFASIFVPIGKEVKVRYCAYKMIEQTHLRAKPQSDTENKIFE